MTRSHFFSSLILSVCVGLPAASAVVFPTHAMSQVTPAQSTQAVGGPQFQMLTPAQAAQDIALMRRALETIHPGLYRRTSKAQIDRAFASLEAAARRPISEGDLYRHISLVLADIRCNHTKAEQTSTIETWRRDNPSHLPFRFQLLEGKMIVESSDPNQVGLERGTEIISINGRPVRSMVRTLGAYVPIDGQTTWSRASKLASDGDLMGSDFDHFYPYVYGFETRFILEIRDLATGKKRNVTMTPLNFLAFQQLPFSGAAIRADFRTSTNWRMLNTDTAYLKVGTFVNYRNPVDAKAFYGEIFTAINQAGASRLILDLRNNGGGSSDATLGLADFLIMRPYVWQRAIIQKSIRIGDLQNSINTWGDRKAIFEAPLENYQATAEGFSLLPSQNIEELLPRAPSGNRFTGTVTVLTSPTNASASTMLIAKLRDEGRVHLVGGRAGGSGDGPTAGRIFNVMLPNSKITIRIPNALNAMQLSQFERSGGVVPDRLIEQSVADFRNGKDTVLEAALNQAPSPTANQTVRDANAFTAQLSGSWRGTLTYRDYQNSGRVTLPTELTIAQSQDKQSANFAYTYDDGPGKIVRSVSSWRLDATQLILAKETKDGTELYRTDGIGLPQPGQPLLLTLWGQGTENGAPVDARETLEVTPTTLRVLRETRLKGQGAFEFRHEYRFAKQ